MDGHKPRRSYIRRKRCLSECVKLIQNTLRQVIAAVRPGPINEQKIAQMAQKYAQEVEAHCWSPRLQITDEAYQQLTIAKAKELCKALIAKEIFPNQPVMQPVAPPVTVPAMKPIASEVYAPRAVPLAQFTQPNLDQLDVTVPPPKQELPFSHSVPEEDDDDFPMFWNPQRQTAERTNSPTTFPFFR